MPTIGFLWIIFHSAHGLAAPFLLPSGQGKHLPVSLSEIEGALVNDICFQNQPKGSCLALQAWRQPSKVDQMKGGIAGNYAGRYCEVLGAKQIFLLNSSNKEQQVFCAFSDLSMIAGNSLYRKHMKAYNETPGKRKP
jgi:hypothetical protein